MTTKHFLPTPVLSFDIEETKDRILPSIERSAPSHARLPRCVKKFLPILGIFTMLFGSAFLGASFTTVNDGQVGYYTPSAECGVGCNAQLFSPGVYFALPWSKGTFNIADVMDRNITVGTIPGLELNGTCMALQHVKNVTEYIASLILFSNSETRLLSEIIPQLKNIISLRPFANLTYGTRGLTFSNPYFV
jgi:hypothetical protein